MDDFGVSRRHLEIRLTQGHAIATPGLDQRHLRRGASCGRRHAPGRQHTHSRSHPDHVLGRLSGYRGRRVSELAFTIARLGFLALLWFFVFLIIRILRRDTA